ncbi:MAG TPA: hypothetical protein VNG12_04460 [Acidimicrobiales bacterium]|nr:hypothetical protein [Acidimicrobiales bacterium]
MPPSMAVVSDEPRKPRAFLVGRKRWKGQAHPETTTVDPWSHGGDEEIRLFQSAYDLGKGLPRVTELGITVSWNHTADDSSDCLRLRSDDMSDDRGDAVGAWAGAPVETRFIDALDLAPNLIMKLPEEAQDGGSHVRGSHEVRWDWHRTL